MGPMGGPMEFGRSKSKFQEVPETGVAFADVAVSDASDLPSSSASAAITASIRHTVHVAD